MPLIRLIYHSRNKLALPLRRLVKPVADIMAVSIARNRKRDITGSLIYDESWFVQVLEGDEQAIHDTYRRITRDPRHEDCQVMDARRISERLFEYWWSAPVHAPDDPGPEFDPRTYAPADLIKLVQAAARAPAPTQLVPV